MPGSSKKRTHHHAIDSRAQDLFRSKLPPHWVVREYRPDYGIDFSVELFEDPQEGSRTFTSETLGEHLLFQLKGIEECDPHNLTVYGRKNVEKNPLSPDTSDVYKIPTIRKPIETSELVTVQRMGAALPVLLVIAELKQNECYFICLNDYIDKILIPSQEDYASADSRTIHVPTRNAIASNELGIVPLRWYAKRPKLYAAFQKFHYQFVELQYASNTTEFLPIARHFASLLKSYDFWSNTEMWLILAEYFNALQRFIETGNPGLMREAEGVADYASAIGRDIEEVRTQLREQFHEQEVMQLWHGLSVLPRQYEELCREWYLPTPLGIMSSYPT